MPGPVISKLNAQINRAIAAVAETVPGYEWTGWYGLVAPAGTSSAIIAKLNAEQNVMLKSAEFRERLAGIGAEPLGFTSQQYGEHLRTQLAKMREAIKISGAELE